MAATVKEGERILWILRTTDVPDGSVYSWTVTGISQADVVQPLTGKFTVFNNMASTYHDTIPDGLNEGIEYATMTLDGIGVLDTVAITDDVSFSITGPFGCITEGETATLNIVSSGIGPATLPFTVTGYNLGGRTITPTSGTVNISAQGTGTINVTVSDDGTYTGGAYFEVKVTNTGGTLTYGSVNVCVVDDEPAPGLPMFIRIPLTWAAEYNNDTGKAVKVYPYSYVTVPQARTGHPSLTVPTSVNTDPATGAITIASTANIDVSTVQSGVKCDIITSGFTSDKGVVYGTMTPVMGYVVN